MKTVSANAWFMRAKFFFCTLIGMMLTLGMLCCGNPTNKESVLNQPPAYDWQPAITAPREFPFELLEASFEDAAGNPICAMIPRTITGSAADSADWGRPGDVEILGEPEKPLPAALRLKWYDFREQQYYEGTFHFDPDALAARFKAGFDNAYEDGRHEPFRYLSVGIAPGGSVSVWLAGGSASWRELAAHFEAGPAQPSEELMLRMTDGSFGDDPQRYARAKAAFLGPQGSTPPDSNELQRWRETYQQTVSYDVQPASRGYVQVLSLTYFNGAVRSYPGNALPAGARTQPLPSVIRINWSGNARAALGETTYAAYRFDEGEVYQAFRELGGQGPLELTVELTTIGNVLNCTLKNGSHFYRFTKGHMM